MNFITQGEIKMQQDKSKQKKAKLFLLYCLCKQVAIKWWKQGIKSPQGFPSQSDVLHSLIVSGIMMSSPVFFCNVNTANKQTTVSLI